MADEVKCELGEHTREVVEGTAGPRIGSSLVRCRTCGDTTTVVEAFRQKINRKFGAAWAAYGLSPV